MLNLQSHRVRVLEETVCHNDVWCNVCGGHGKIDVCFRGKTLHNTLRKGKKHAPNHNCAQINITKLQHNAQNNQRSFHGHALSSEITVTGISSYL